MNESPLQSSARRAAAPSVRPWSQRGEGRVSFLFWTAVLILALMCGFEFVPKRWRVAQMEDYLVEAAKQASFRNSEQLKKMILVRASELGLPIDEKELDVKVTTRSVSIRTEYVLPLDFPLYTYDWNVRHDVRRQVFRF